MLYSLSGTRRFCKADPCKANLNRLWVFLTVWIQMKFFLGKVNFPEKFHSNPDRWKHSWTTLIRPSSAPCTIGFPVPSRYFFFLCAQNLPFQNLPLLPFFVCVYKSVKRAQQWAHHSVFTTRDLFLCPTLMIGANFDLRTTTTRFKTK